VTNTDKRTSEFHFTEGVDPLLNYAEAESKASNEFKRIVRSKLWRHAHLRARGVQDHMEFTLLGSGWNTPPEFIDVPMKLQRLILAARIAHFENGHKNWYHYHLRAEFAVTRGGYNLDKTVDCDKEPTPFNAPLPWEKAMVEDAEFDIPFENLPKWLQERLIKQD
jgi:hypothetical protein